MKFITLLIIISLTHSSYGQIKIGDITIDNKIAKEYFQDCYLHPDIVTPEQEYGLPDEWGREQNSLIRERNNELIIRSIGKRYDTIYYEAYNDTLYDGVLWASYDFKKGVKKITIEHQKAGRYIQFKGYLIPRKPSEIDFIKWQNKYLK